MSILSLEPTQLWHGGRRSVLPWCGQVRMFSRFPQKGLEQERSLAKADFLNFKKIFYYISNTCSSQGNRLQLSNRKRRREYHTAQRAGHVKVDPTTPLTRLSRHPAGPDGCLVFCLLPLPVLAPSSHQPSLNCLLFSHRQPWFYGWGFNLPRGQALLEKWNLIPEGVDVLITHGPPLGKGQRPSPACLL